MYPPFVSHARKLLIDNDILIRFIDVGSRNGILGLASVAEFVDAYGFEPNPVEYEKLIGGRTDASKAGIKSPQYHSIHYSNKAISDHAGRHKFFITHGPGTCGLREPNFERLQEIRWQGRKYKKNYADEIFAVDNIIEVKVSTLAEFAKEHSFDSFDYLKIDTEGSDYEVLAGGANILNKIGVIKTEVNFFPLRKNQKLFSDIDILLRDYGFELLKYEISPAQIAFKERTLSWDFGPAIGMPERYGQPITADAIYVNRNISDRKRIIAQAVVLLEKNYLDEALFILRTKTGLEDRELFNLLRNYRGQWRTRLINSIFRFGRRFISSPHLWK